MVTLKVPELDDYCRSYKRLKQINSKVDLQQLKYDSEVEAGTAGGYTNPALINIKDELNALIVEQRQINSDFRTAELNALPKIRALTPGKEGTLKYDLTEGLAVTIFKMWFNENLYGETKQTINQSGGHISSSM